MEHKLARVDALELKFDSAKLGHFSGYASAFGGVDSYGDTIAPGAYKSTLVGRDRAIAMRWNHYGPVIGKWVAMGEDEKGLYVEGQLTPGHSVANDVYASLKHGSVDGLSIGFRIKKQEQTGEDTRTLTEIDLIEISVVEQPADLAARVGDVKSAIEDAQSLQEIEALLRDVAGLSKLDVKTLVSRIKSFGRRDAVPDKRIDFGLLLALQAATATLR